MDDDNKLYKVALETVGVARDVVLTDIKEGDAYLIHVMVKSAIFGKALCSVN